MKTLRIFAAFFQALLPFIGFAIIAVVIFAQVNPPFNIILCIICLLIGLLISRSTFNMMRRRGVIEVLSGGSASYELDDLTPLESDGVSKFEPSELANAFEQKTLEINKATVSIWGDFEGRHLDKKHIIHNIIYNSESNVLTIEFKGDCLMKIKSPKLIFCSSTYLKIIKAKEVLWQTPTNSDTVESYSYLNTGKCIKTKSNTEWKPHKYDLGIGKNAVYMQS